MLVKDQHMLLSVFWNKGIGSDSKQLEVIETKWLKTVESNFKWSWWRISKNILPSQSPPSNEAPGSTTPIVLQHSHVEDQKLVFKAKARTGTVKFKWEQEQERINANSIQRRRTEPKP
jgi:hypothetical protein